MGDGVLVLLRPAFLRVKQQMFYLCLKLLRLIAIGQGLLQFFLPLLSQGAGEFHRRSDFLAPRLDHLLLLVVQAANGRLQYVLNTGRPSFTALLGVR